MNKVILIGRTTKEIEVKHTTSGRAVTRFNLAVYRNADNTDFIPCIAWEKNAETLGQYVRKGNRIAVIGSIVTGSYDKNGETRNYTEVNVERVEFLEKFLEKVNDKQETKPSNDDMEEMTTDDGLPF